MALIRAELQGLGKGFSFTGAQGAGKKLGIYDGIVEYAADLNSGRPAEFGAGSLLYCLEDGKLYVRDSAGQWNGVSA